MRSLPWLFVSRKRRRLEEVKMRSGKTPPVLFLGEGRDNTGINRWLALVAGQPSKHFIVRWLTRSLTRATYARRALILVRNQRSPVYRTQVTEYSSLFRSCYLMFNACVPVRFITRVQEVYPNSRVRSTFEKREKSPFILSLILIDR